MAVLNCRPLLVFPMMCNRKSTSLSQVIGAAHSVTLGKLLPSVPVSHPCAKEIGLGAPGKPFLCSGMF